MSGGAVLALILLPLAIVALAIVLAVARREG
jgi:hypothetical protein